MTARRAALAGAPASGGTSFSDRCSRNNHGIARAPRKGRQVLSDEDDATVYDVVVNHEEQYSIWAAGRSLPAGWRKAGKTGTKEECLAYVDDVWTDMRPLSLRRKMDDAV